MGIEEKLFNIKVVFLEWCHFYDPMHLRTCPAPSGRFFRKSSCKSGIHWDRENSYNSSVQFQIAQSNFLKNMASTAFLYQDFIIRITSTAMININKTAFWPSGLGRCTIGNLLIALKFEITVGLFYFFSIFRIWPKLWGQIVLFSKK